MLTDQDLTAALHDYADRNAPDVAAVRAAIEHGISGGRLVDPVGSRGSDALDGSAGWYGRRGRKGRRRPLALAAVAACTLALVGVGLVITRQRQNAVQDPGPSSTAPSLPLPDIGSLPGTRLLDSFSGTGTGIILLAAYAVPAGFELQALFACRGAGAVKFYAGDAGSDTIPLGCLTESVIPALSSQQHTLHVVAGASTRWRIALAVVPKVMTNGSVQSPASSALAKPLVYGQGTGTFPAPAGVRPGAMVELTCVGTGVSLTSANHRFDGNYTHTCLAGYSYVFRISRAGLPTTVTVHADSNTTWKLALLDY